MLAAVSIAACDDRGGDGVPQVDPDFVEVQDPNRFLQFLNRQAGLPAGEYTLVAGTKNPGASGGFSITAERDDGRVRTFVGSWPDSGSGGTDAGSPANPRFAFSMPYSGGATFEIESQTDTCLFLLDAGGAVMAGKDNGKACSNRRRIELPASKINVAANARAYYKAIDPDDTRDTLRGWQQANGFGEPCGPTYDPCEVHVIFRDTKDLGYGRDMYARRNEDGSFAVYVRNFRVNAVSGQQYTTLNLDAAVANNMDPARENSIRWHFGSNAIEFSTYPYGDGEPRDGEIATFATNDGEAPMFTKYFTFRPDDVNDPNTTERRLDVVDLDGRGEKSMPGPCISCHGGKSRPLLPNGDFPPPIPGGVPGDTQAQMQVVEVGTLEFSDVPGWQCEDIIEGIHFVNQGVLDTYRVVKEQYDGVQGYWQPGFAAELIKGWYGDTAGATDPDDFTIDPAPGDPDYDAAQACSELTSGFYDYVPTGWRPDPATGTPPAGADDLFREVIAPNCMVCHSRRGTNLGTDQSPGERQDIDFSTYERFISHASQVERFLFHKGVMPLGLLNFDAFWDNSEPGRAELLASHLPGFASYREDGSLQKPGRPYPVVAAPRDTNVPVTISAEGSSFADGYNWSVVDTPAGASASLTPSEWKTARAVFDADMDGDYTLELSVYGNGERVESSFVITVDSSLPVPADIRFDPDIKSVLQDDGGPNCDRCHSPPGSPGSPIDGVPVYYVDTASQPEGRDLYLEVLQRVNFNEPVESLLLRKPSGNHHYGECREGFDLTGAPGDCNGINGDRSNYDLILNWILQGAPR